MDKTLEHYTEQAELAGYMRDALRYRYLRECQSIHADILLNTFEYLDAAIDNAIAAMEKSK